MGVVPAINRTARFIERCASVCLAVITVVIFISALARYMFNSPIPDAHGLSSLLLGIAVLWGLACVTWQDGHIGVDLVWLACSPGVRRAMDIFGLVLIIVFIALLSWKLLDRIESVQRSGITTVDLRLAIWPYYVVAWGGVVAALVLALARFWLLVFKPDALPEHKSLADTGPGGD